MALISDLRFWLAGPSTLIAAFLLMAAMPVWFPPGAAGINHLAFPLVVFPAVWAVLFFYAVLAENLQQAAWVLLSLTIINGSLAAWAAWGS